MRKTHKYTSVRVRDQEDAESDQVHGEEDDEFSTNEKHPLSEDIKSITSSYHTNAKKHFRTKTTMQKQNLPLFLKRLMLCIALFPFLACTDISALIMVQKHECDTDENNSIGIDNFLLIGSISHIFAPPCLYFPHVLFLMNRSNSFPHGSFIKMHFFCCVTVPGLFSLHGA